MVQLIGSNDIQFVNALVVGGIPLAVPFIIEESHGTSQGIADPAGQSALTLFYKQVQAIVAALSRKQDIAEVIFLIEQVEDISAVFHLVIQPFVIDTGFDA